MVTPIGEVDVAAIVVDWKAPSQPTPLTIENSRVVFDSYLNPVMGIGW